jgi:Zn-dependent protease
MNRTLRLGRIAGVNVGLHWSVLFIAGLLTAGLAGERFPTEAAGYSETEYVAAAAITAVAFLACILAHELSHAVVARRERIGVDGITLWFLGGVTHMTTEVSTPEAELAISGIGPLTSFLLGIVLGGAGIVLRVASISPLIVAVLRWLGVINVVLAVFNVLPGAPLDGGRLLHAFVWHRHGDPLRATKVATRAGTLLGSALIGIGLAEFAFGTAVGGGLWLVLLGWFLRSSARLEAAHATTDHDDVTGEHDDVTGAHSSK